MENLISEWGLPASLLDRQQHWVRHFQSFKGWENRYKEIIRLGKQMPPMDNGLYDDQYLVKGCQSKVWLKAQKVEDRVHFLGDSDAMIVKGLVILLVSVYWGQSPKDIASSSAEFLKEMGFHQALSPSRANGVNAMIQQIKLYGHALSLL